MFTLQFIKNSSKLLDTDDIKKGKEKASRYRKLSAWWAYDCIEMYKRFSASDFKVFWWMMVVESFRYANDYQRKKEQQK